MNNFWTLSGYELKKIFIKKPVVIFLVLGLAFNIFSCFAMVVGGNSQSDYGDENLSNYESMLMGKAYEKELEGRPLDGNLILEASNAYKKIESGAAHYTKTEGYQKYARKYSSIFGLIDAAFAQPGKAFNVADFQTISKETADNYYTYRENQYRLNLSNNPLWADTDVEIVMDLGKDVQKPFIMAYKDGYERFFALSTSTMAILLILISFCLSPVFSNEYNTNIDALILTSKQGKSTFIYAKIFASLIFSFSLTLLFVFFTYLGCMAVYGFDGGSAQIQLIVPAITYNFTIFESAILILVTSAFGGLLHTGLCLFISSLSKNSIIPMTISTIFIAVGMFQGINNVFFAKLRYFLPSAMGNFWDVITQLVFNFFGVEIMLYQAVCTVAFVIGGLLLLLSYRNFRRHQVN